MWGLKKLFSIYFFIFLLYLTFSGVFFVFILFFIWLAAVDGGVIWWSFVSLGLGLGLWMDWRCGRLNWKKGILAIDAFLLIMVARRWCSDELGDEFIGRKKKSRGRDDRKRKCENEKKIYFSSSSVKINFPLLLLLPHLIRIFRVYFDKDWDIQFLYFSFFLLIFLIIIINIQPATLCFSVQFLFWWLFSLDGNFSSNFLFSICLVSGDGGGRGKGSEWSNGNGKIVIIVMLIAGSWFSFRSGLWEISWLSSLGRSNSFHRCCCCIRSCPVLSTTIIDRPHHTYKQIRRRKGKFSSRQCVLCWRISISNFLSSSLFKMWNVSVNKLPFSSASGGFSPSPIGTLVTARWSVVVAVIWCRFISYTVRYDIYT